MSLPFVEQNLYQHRQHRRSELGACCLARTWDSSLSVLQIESSSSDQELERKARLGTIWVKISNVLSVTGTWDNLHDKISNNYGRFVRTSVSILESISKDQAQGQGTTKTNVDVSDSLRLRWTSSKIVLPGSLTQLNGDFEDMRDGVLNDHNNVKDHDKGQEDISRNEGIATIDHKDDEGGESENKGDDSEDEEGSEGD